MQLSDTWARLTGDVREPLSHAGWATRSLYRSTVRGSAFLLAGWMVVLVATMFAEPGPIQRLWLVALAHVIAIVPCVAVLRGRIPAAVLLPMAYALFIWDMSTMSSKASVYCFATIWLANFTHIGLSLVLAGRAGRWAPLAAVAVVPVAMYAVRPQDGWDYPIATLVTIVATTLAVRLGLSYLFEFAKTADDVQREAEVEARRLTEETTASRSAAEDARTLHDTVINTLGAIARGGAAVSDPDLLRDRCTRDAATLEHLLSRGVADDVADGSLRILPALGIRVIRTGLTDDALGDLNLPAHVAAALTAATAELVQNAAKHSGCAEVLVDIQRSDGVLVVTVADEGRGFDGTVPVGQGLAESVVARLAGVEIHTDIRTAPGKGTRVQLSHWEGVTPDHAPKELSSTIDFAEVVSQMRVRSGFIIGVGLSLVGFMLAVANHPGTVSPELGMAAVGLAACGLAWRSWRRHGRLSPVVLAVLALASAVGWMFSGLGVQFGRTDPAYWQAIGPMGGLLVVISTAGDKRVSPWVAVPYVVTVAGTAFWMLGHSFNSARCIGVSGVIGLTFVAAWYLFNRDLGRIGAQAAAAQREALAARLVRVSREAAARARERWRAAGLPACLDLLRRLADGRADPESPDVRSACVAEEAYLRQLTQLSPDLIWMGSAFAAGLSKARSAGVRLTVRTGDTDAPEEAADMLTMLLTAVIDRVPAGGSVTATLIPTGDAVRFSLVAQHPALSDVADGWAAPAGARHSLQSFADQDVLEVVLAP